MDASSERYPVLYSNSRQYPVSLGFFHGDLLFGNEIRLAMGILRFADIRADGDAGTTYLVGGHGFMPYFQGFDKIYD